MHMCVHVYALLVVRILVVQCLALVPLLICFSFFRAYSRDRTREAQKTMKVCLHVPIYHTYNVLPIYQYINICLMYVNAYLLACIYVWQYCAHVQLLICFPFLQGGHHATTREALMNIQVCLPAAFFIYTCDTYISIYGKKRGVT